MCSWIPGYTISITPNGNVAIIISAACIERSDDLLDTMRRYVALRTSDVRRYDDEYEEALALLRDTRLVRDIHHA